MGANDAAEQLEAAKAEVVRLERIIQGALNHFEQPNPDDLSWTELLRILEKYKEAK